MLASNFETFSDLIRKLCLLVQIDDVGQILAGCPINISGVAMVLAYNAKYASHLGFIYCDFGIAPYGQESVFYEALLRENVVLNIGLAPSFGMSSETKNVLCTVPFELSEMTADALQKKLLMLADYANGWREKNLLPTNDTFLNPTSLNQDMALKQQFMKPV